MPDGVHHRRHTDREDSRSHRGGRRAPHIAPARGPPLWDACDAQTNEGGRTLSPIGIWRTLPAIHNRKVDCHGSAIQALEGEGDRRAALSARPVCPRLAPERGRWLASPAAVAVSA